MEVFFFVFFLSSKNVFNKPLNTKSNFSFKRLAHKNVHRLIIIIIDIISPFHLEVFLYIF